MQEDKKFSYICEEFYPEKRRKNGAILGQCYLVEGQNYVAV